MKLLISLLLLCGTSHGLMLLSLPTSGFCTSGTVTGGMVDKDGWRWTCRDGDIKEVCGAVSLNYCLKHCKICIPGEQAFCPEEVVIQ